MKRSSMFLWGIVFCVVLGGSLGVYFYYKTFPNVENQNLPEDYITFFWYAPWNNASYDSLLQNYDKIDYLSPVWLSVDENGIIHISDESSIAHIVSFCHSHNIRVVPLISNYGENGFDGNLIQSFLGNASAIQSFLLSYHHLVMDYGFDGINIDFEGVPSECRANLTSFVSILSSNFTDDMVLSIDVPAKSYDSKTGWSGAYDYAALGEICDFVCVMTYDYHWSGSSPGAIAPYSWASDCIGYAVSVMSPERVLAGIPLYGYDWGDGEGLGAGYDYFSSLVSEYGISPSRDRSSGELTFKYTDSSGVGHVCYYPDAETVCLKMKNLSSLGCGGYCYWYLGLTDAFSCE